MTEGGGASSSWQPSQFSSESGLQMAGEEPDYDALLDLGDIDLDFPMYDAPVHGSVSGDGHGIAHNSQSLGDTMDAMESLHDGDFLGFDPGLDLAPQQHHHQDVFGASPHVDFQPPNAVPPTPNSYDLRAQTRPYGSSDRNVDIATKRPLDHSHHNMYTPATTPAEFVFQASQCNTVPGAYFSRLTSPSIEPRTYATSVMYTPYAQSPGTSVTTSPVDFSSRSLEEVPMQPPGSRRKARTRSTITRPTSAAGVTPSPVSRSQRKRGAASFVDEHTSAPAQADAQKGMNEALSAASSLLRPGSARQDGSGTDSISSPEPLSESVMGPPPRPSSNTSSPFIAARNGQASDNSTCGDDAGVIPATPASLMRLTPRGHDGQGTPRAGPTSRSESQSPTMHPNVYPSTLEDLTLPEAASSAVPKRTPATGSDTLTHNGGADAGSKGTSSRKTPKLNPLSTPSGSGGGSSALASPAPSSGVSSPVSATAATAAAAARRAGKGRNTKMVSPSLRPRISPSIKPLLPEGASGDDSHAALLANRSNYQNIIDGTTVPGLTYHADLSTTLKSKRTSHKLAEQGRRNRINIALQEMQSLLPAPAASPTTPTAPTAPATAPPTPTARAPTSPDLVAQQQQQQQQAAGSKAATVESAIEYIKQLRREIGDRDRELEDLRQRLSTADDAGSGPASEHGGGGGGDGE